jgi:hypothetical protein
VTRWFVVLLLLLPSAAQGGWIVLRNGTSIETKGVWVASKTHVAYYDPKTGKANVVPVGFVDLEKSRAATKAGSPPPAPAREKVVITDADVGNYPAAVAAALARFNDAVAADNIAAALAALDEMVKAGGASLRLNMVAERCAISYANPQAQALCRVGRPVPTYMAGEYDPAAQAKADLLGVREAYLSCYESSSVPMERRKCIERVRRESGGAP